MSKPTRIGIIGCGNIAEQYMKTLSGASGLEIAGVVDLDTDRARSFAEAHGLPFVESYEGLLADDSVEIITNLTIHTAHFEITRAALEAGKHVYSEKPLALVPEEARALVRLAEQKGLRLSCAPITYLGEAQQTLARRVRSGSIGDVRVIYAEVNHGRIETWHPNPAPFYSVGPILDVGPYPVALVTSILGPVRTVRAWGKIVLPERSMPNGQAFRVESPDFVTAVMELETGAIMRLTTNFYVGNMTPGPQNVEFHGIKGSALVESWFNFSAKVRAGDFGQPMEEVPNDFKEPYPGVEWSRGLKDLAAAIREGRPHRASGAHAAHVVEILCAINASVANNGQIQEISSKFPLPEPLAL